MNLQRREEISALLAAPVTGGAGQVLEYRDALMECRAHIDTLEQTAAERVIADGKARAVVVPEIMLSDISDECGAMLCDDREAFRRGALWAQKFITSRVRAISSDRVLGEGMVQVDRQELALLRKIAGMWCPPFGVPHNPESVALFDALRANQGGAAT